MHTNFVEQLHLRLSQPLPGAAAMRPAVLDVIRSAGGTITGLTASEGRLDEFYRDLVGGVS